MQSSRRGLVITGGHAPQVPVVIPDRAGCLIVAADSGLDYVARQGLYPDAIVGDMDSLADHSLLDRFPDAVVERYDRAKDLTDTEIALEYLWKENVKPVTILGGGGGRLDHLLGIVALFERDRYPYRWITDREEVVLVDGELSFEATVGQTVSFLPIGPEPATMESTGLRWNLDGLTWYRGDVGISNECTGERCRVTMRSGRLLMVRALPAQVQLP